MNQPLPDQVNKIKVEDGYEVWSRSIGGGSPSERTPLLLIHGGPGVPHQYLQNLRVAQFQQAPEPLGGAAFAAAVASQGRVRGFRLGGGRRGVRLARPPAPDRRPLVGQPTVRGAGANAGLNRRVVRRGAVGAHRPVRRPADQARHCPPHGDSRVLGETVTPRRR